MKFVFYILFLSQLAFAQNRTSLSTVDQFKSDCEEVGNYIHDNTKVNTLYKLYNGLGHKKVSIYNTNFASSLNSLRYQSGISIIDAYSLKNRIGFYEGSDFETTEY